jgi:hypothetical protein
MFSLFDFAFHFFAVYVQRRVISSRRFLFIIITYFCLTGHHQVYRLLWWRNLLLTVKFFCFSYVFVSGSRLYELTSCFIWVSLNNYYVRNCLICSMWCVMLGLHFKVHTYIQLLYIWCYLRFSWLVDLCPVADLNVFVWAEVCCMAVGHRGCSL